MLDFIRKNAQSWIVKVLFAVIVIVFVFWGVGSYNTSKRSIVATINGGNLTIEEFKRAYDRSVEAMRAKNPELTLEDIEKFNLKRQVFEQLRDSRLLAAKAREWGIVISDEELRREIAKIEAFQGAAKRFDPDRYKRILQANRVSMKEFESDYSHNLLMEKMQEYVKMTSAVSKEAARDFYTFARAKIRLQYILMDFTEYTSRISPAEERIEEYYRNNSDQFAIPDKIQIEYIIFSPEELAAYETATEEEITSFYSQNKNLYERDEQVRAKHILIKLPPNATPAQEQEAKKTIQSIRLQLKQGKSFEELARKYSDDPSSARGGDLGWFEKGVMVPAFEQTAFSQGKGEVSDPVRTQFGYHLIKTVDHREAGIRKLDEVKDQIATRIKQEKAADNMADLLDQVLERIIGGQDLKDAANSVNLEVRVSDYFSLEQGPGLNLSPTQKATIFSLQTGEVTDTPLLLENGYLLAEKTGDKPGSIQPLEAVKGRIVSTLKQRGARNLAKEQADLALADLLQGKTEQWQDDLQTTEPVGRSGVIPELGLNPDLIRNLFLSQEGEWLNRPYEVSNGFLVARLTERINPSEADWEVEQDFWLETINELRKQELFQAFMEQLRKEAEVVLVNPQYLQ